MVPGQDDLVDDVTARMADAPLCSDLRVLSRRHTGTTGFRGDLKDIA